MTLRVERQLIPFSNKPSNTNVGDSWLLLSNRLGSLALNKVPGEDVSTLEASEIARELEGSGSAPADLVNLVSKPCTKGSNEMFKTHVLCIW